MPYLAHPPMTATTIDPVRLRYQIIRFWVIPILILTAEGNFWGFFNVVPQANEAI